MSTKPKIAIFASGNGSNFQAIADAIARGSGAKLVLHSPASGRTDGFEAVLSLNSAT